MNYLELADRRKQEQANLQSLIDQKNEIEKAIGYCRGKIQRLENAMNDRSGNVVQSEQAIQWAAEYNARTPIKNIPVLTPPGKVLKK